MLLWNIKVNFGERTMMYDAVIIGDDFSTTCQRGSTGRIHSVFDRAVNIEIKNSSQQLLTLIYEDIDIMSANLVVRTMNNNWRDLLSENKQVILTPDTLYVDNKPFILGISTAQKWFRITDCQIAKMSHLADQSNILELCQEVESYLSLKEISSIDFPDINISNLDPLALIGLGNGLTPSGDDFLSGLLHGLHFMEILFGIKFLPLSNIALNISGQLFRTGSISQHFLRYALKAQWGLNIENFLLALILGDKEALIKSTDKKLRTGASSGYDEIMGCIYGIKQYILNS